MHLLSIAEAALIISSKCGLVLSCILIKSEADTRYFLVLVGLNRPCNLKSAIKSLLFCFSTLCVFSANLCFYPEMPKLL